MLTGENLAGNVCFGMHSEAPFPVVESALIPSTGYHAYGCAFDMLTPLLSALT